MFKYFHNFTIVFAIVIWLAFMSFSFWPELILKPLIDHMVDTAFDQAFDQVMKETMKPMFDEAWEKAIRERSK